MAVIARSEVDPTTVLVFGGVNHAKLLSPPLLQVGVLVDESVLLCAIRRRFHTVMDTTNSITILTCDDLLEAGPAGSSHYANSGGDEAHLYAALASAGIPYRLRSWRERDRDRDGSPSWSSPCLLVIIRTVWDYFLTAAHFTQFTALLTSLEDSGTPTLNHPRVVRWNAHKGYLDTLHRDSGIVVVPTAYAPLGSGSVDLCALTAARGWGRGILLKPCIGGGSRGCMRTTTSTRQGVAAAQAFLDAALRPSDPDPDSGPSDPPLTAPASLCEAHDGPTVALDAPCTCGDWPRDYMIQPFLTSVEAGELSVVVIDGAISHAVCKLPRAGEFKTQAEHGGVATRMHLSRSEEALVYRVLAAARTAVERDGGGPLPPGAILCARVDFLRISEEERGLFGGCFDAGDDHPPLALLELELIDPSLFFGEGPRREAAAADGSAAFVSAAAEALATAIAARVART